MNPTIEITGVAHGGHGVGRVDGQVCFVPYALPGDTVDISIARRSKGVLWGAIETVVEESPHRTCADCPVFGRCGGCTWLHFAYPAQAEWKQRIVSDCLARIADIETELEWIENPDLRLGYRTRATFQCFGTTKGFYALRTRDVIDIENCPLCHEKLNNALQRVREGEFNDAVEIVVNPDGQKTLVWTKRPNAVLKKVFPFTESSKSKGQRASFLFDGAPIVNGAFSQSSLLLNRLLVRTVRELAGSRGNVLDLYCGNGNLSMHLAAPDEVLGLDHSGAAVTAAAAVGKGTYRVGAEREFKKAINERAWDVIILDPPRTGAKAIIDTLASCSADAIVYVSCDPATLARDLKVLVADDWKLERASVIDLFPHTAHMETVCKLVR